MDKPIVTIGIPTGDYFSIVRATALDMMRMIAYSMNEGVCEKIQLESAASPSTDRNRNALVGGMWDQSQFMLQIDADMTFPEDTLKKMLESYAKIFEREQRPFVLTGLGFMGQAPFFPALFKAVRRTGNLIVPVEPKKGEYDGWVPVQTIPSEPFEVDACGSFGFLIPYEIFSIFKGWGGWFNHHIDMDPEDKTKFLEIRHDLAFTMRVRESGYKIFCDPAIEFGHIRPRPIKREIWENYAQQNLHYPDASALFDLNQFRARHIGAAFPKDIADMSDDAV